MADIAVDALLAPLADAAPCGDDLEYDPAFLALEEAARGKPEQQFGDTVIAALEPDWRAMNEQSIALLARTRDLRVAVQLLRAATRLDGCSGFASGIALLHGLLERHWEHVYPQLDAADDNDPTMRLNALAPLTDAGSVLADLRAAAVGNGRDGADRAPARARARQGRARRAASRCRAPTAVAQALGKRRGRVAPALLDELLQAHQVVRASRRCCTARVGAAEAPDLRALRALTQCMAQMAQQARRRRRREPAVPTAPAAAPRRSLPRGRAGGAIASRDDAIQTLDRVCDWIERHEPSNPAPLLIRRAQRLMSKNFIDIIRDLAPDGLKEVERIAGVDAE